MSHIPDPDATISAEKPGYAQLSDPQLAELASEGDFKAYSFIYDRNFEAIYDFALRTARGAEPATDAVAEAFARVWDKVTTRETALDLRPGLFAAAREAILADPRAQQARNHLEEAALLPAGYSIQAPSDQKAGMTPEEYSDLVWRAAASLPAKDYSLLHINLRGGIAVPDIADTFGIKRKQVESMLRKLQDSLDHSVATILLMRQGPKECPELDGLLVKLKTTETPPGEIRSAVADHMDKCKVCELTRGAYAFPPVVFAALVPIQAPEDVKRALWNRISEYIEESPSAKGAVRIGSGAAVSGKPAVVGLAKKNAMPMWLKLAAIVTIIGLVAAGGYAVVNRSNEPGVQDPADIKSATHFVGVASSTDVVEVTWSRVEDALNYSVEWSKGNRDLPDTDPDLPGWATSSKSDKLGEGWWYFHLRTQGKDKMWTSTVHFGPFVIRGTAPASPSPPPGELILTPVSPSPSPTEPSLSIADLVIAEGNTGAVSASLAVTLAPKAENEVRIDFATANKTATAPADYREARGKLIFTAGQTKKTIKVPLVVDTVNEPDETFLVNLTNPTGAKLTDGQATVTIKNDDGATAAPAIAVGDAQANEGGVVGFPVTLSGATAKPVTVGFATANGSATSPGDFTGAVGTLTFAAGQTTGTVPVQTSQDSDDEPNETFTLNLSSATNATIADGSATGTIVDDDAAPAPDPTVSILTAQISGDGKTAIFPVKLSAASTKTVTVTWTLSPGDGVSPDSGSVTFAPGDVEESISITEEPGPGEHTFTVSLTGATNATVGSPSQQAAKL